MFSFFKLAFVYHMFYCVSLIAGTALRTMSAFLTELFTEIHLERTE